MSIDMIWISEIVQLVLIKTHFNSKPANCESANCWALPVILILVYIYISFNFAIVTHARLLPNAKF